jgi:hypothetical protein
VVVRPTSAGIASTVIMDLTVACRQRGWNGANGVRQGARKGRFHISPPRHPNGACPNR